MSKPRNPGYMPGNYWLTCDRCGFAYRLKDMRKTWDNQMVCRWDWEPRHPQDFVRSKTDLIAPQGDSRPEPTDEFTTVNRPAQTDTIPEPTHGG